MFVSTNYANQHQRIYLNVAIDQPVQLDVVVILAEWINENFGDFQPANVEAELANNETSASVLGAWIDIYLQCGE